LKTLADPLPQVPSTVNQSSTAFSPPNINALAVWTRMGVDLLQFDRELFGNSFGRPSGLLVLYIEENTLSSCRF